jgi:soluble lytic murein transglycosylase-like protein
MESLRRSPVRNGLIGIAVAGAAAPIAINRYQQVMRTDPSHERVAINVQTNAAASESGVSDAYDRLEEDRGTEETARDRAIAESVREYADFGLTAELAGDIYDIAMESNVDPDIAFGLVRAESSFKNTSTSHVGAVGLTQLMPRTAAWLVPGTTTAELRNPETNLKIGMKYLKQLIDKYEGDVDLALTAYNRGPGTVDRILGRGGNPDNGYAGFVRSGDIGAHKG